MPVPWLRQSAGATEDANLVCALQMAAVVSSATYGFLYLSAGYVLPKPRFPQWWSFVFYGAQPASTNLTGCQHLAACCDSVHVQALAAVASAECCRVLVQLRPECWWSPGMACMEGV